MRATVFGIHKQYVDARAGVVGIEVACYLEEHANAACAVVCAVNRGVVLALVGVSVRPGAAVPVGEQQQPVGRLRVVLPDYVHDVEVCAVKPFQARALQRHLRAVAAQLRLEPCGCVAVRFRADDTRAELDLPLHV